MWLGNNKVKLFLIFLLALFLRLYKLESYPVSLNWDEAAIGYNAYSISQTGKDEYGIVYPLLFKSFNDFKLPGYIYLDSIVISFLGLNEFSVRLPSAIFGTMAIPLFYLIAKELLSGLKIGSTKLSKNTPLIAAALLAISPWHIQFSRAAFEANVALTIFLAGIFLLIYGLKNKWAAYLSIPTLVFSIYFYYSQRLLAPLITISFLALFAINLKNNLKAYLIGLLIGIVISIPIGISFLKPEGNKRISEVSILSDQTIYSDTVFTQSKSNNLLTSVFLNYKVPLALEFFHNYFSHFSWGFLFFSDDPNPRQKIPLTGNLYLLEIVSLPLGLWLLLKFKKSSSKFFIFFWLAITPLAASLAKDSPHSLRALPMVAPILLISALGFQKLFTKKPLKIITLAVLLVSSSAYLVNYYYLYPNANSASWGYGYKQLFMELKKQEGSVDKIIISGANWKPYIYYLFYNRVSPLDYQQIENQTNIGKYVFGPTPWDNNGQPLDDEFIKSSAGSKTLIAITPQEAESLKDKDRFVKASQISDFSGRNVIYELGQWH